MSIIEYSGGPVTYRSLQKKSKSDLCRMYLEAMDVIEDLTGRLKTVEAERDALAAHVERLREALTPFAQGGAADCISWGDYSVMRELIKDWLGVRDFKRATAVMTDDPKTSLARLKAQWQAEAWNEAADHVMALYAPKCARTFQTSAARHLRYKSEKVLREQTPQMMADREANQ